MRVTGVEPVALLPLTSSDGIELMKRRLAGLALFSIAFAFVEAAVVFYLRQILAAELGGSDRSYKELLNLGFIVFVYPDAQSMGNAQLGAVEVTREFCTIVMLAAIAYLSAHTLRQRIGGFLFAFSVWDLFYYLFLKVITGWPRGLLDIDVYFLLPVPWIGPVLTPLVISTVLLLVGVRLYLRDPGPQTA